MEYCGYQDLHQKIKRYIHRKEYIDERIIWVYMIQILEGLKALHDKGVLHRGKCSFALYTHYQFADFQAHKFYTHRSMNSHTHSLYVDLKPANCFLASDGSVKIGDFNVSKVVQEGINASVSLSEKLIRTLLHAPTGP